MREEFRRPGDVEVCAEHAQMDGEDLDGVGAGVQDAGALVGMFGRVGRRPRCDRR
ncbi:hypothetical protein [Nonomuraea wenchangensis]|uniref:hypothetical protein n=1 Tax=Nonomuraea wenchangensis TaxID=568860 RepID=UPI0037BBCCCD